MRVHRGRSFRGDAREAVREIVDGWDEPNPHMIFAFASTKQDLSEIGGMLAERFPGVPMAGCSTAGEQLDGQHSNDSLVLAALETDAIRWQTTLVESLEEATIRTRAQELMDGLEIDRESFDPADYFALTFVDGLSRREESYVATLTDALEGIPVVGGSAGDDLGFRRTLVLEGGRARSGAAVVVLAHAPKAFQLLKHQHFTPTDVMLAVTRVDPAERRVIEFDGLPAAEAFARAIGTTREELSAEATFLKPVLLSVGGESYVRSIQRIEPDGSIVFYCAVEEGMVLQIAAHEDMLGHMKSELCGAADKGPADFLLACNCILRALEAKAEQLHGGLGENLQRLAHSVIGFDTYGEQFNGLHINQTVVGVSLRGAP